MKNNKIKYFLALSIFCLNLISYSSNKDPEIKKIDLNCLHGFIFMVYVGENNAPTSSILLRTNEQDSSYCQYMGVGYDFFMKHDYEIPSSFEKSYMVKSTVSLDDYIFLKQYIITHNTGREQVVKPEDCSSLSPFKIILKDKCDSIVYIVYKTDEEYFNHILDSTSLAKDEKIKSMIDYYIRMSDRVVNEYNNFNQAYMKRWLDR